MAITGGEGVPVGRRGLWLILALALAAGLALPAGAQARGRANVAALQVALRAVGTYGGTVDGAMGRGTRRAVRRFQRRKHLAADGVPGRRTRRALGRRGRPSYGRRTIRLGARGWDVSALQFLLAWQGFPSGTIDGGFGARSRNALIRFQRREGLLADGVAGRRTLRALRGRLPRSPVCLRRPIRGHGVGDGFGPRGNRFHTGLDFPAPSGWNVRAAGFGRASFTGFYDGYGRTVIIRHRFGLRTLYAHLSAITVPRGRRVGVGRRIGRVGSSGFSTGPHLHWEVIHRGANVNPRRALC